MSVSKNRNSDRSFRKLSVKERNFRHTVSKVNKCSVNKSGPTKAPNHLPDKKPNSLREEFIKALKVDDKSDRTIKSYCDAVKMFQNFIHKNPLNVTVNDIRAFFFIS